jgi:hypothetical protein
MTPPGDEEGDPAGEDAERQGAQAQGLNHALPEGQGRDLGLRWQAQRLRRRREHHNDPQAAHLGLSIDLSLGVAILQSGHPRPRLRQDLLSGPALQGPCRAGSDTPGLLTPLDQIETRSAFGDASVHQARHLIWANFDAVAAPAASVEIHQREAIALVEGAGRTDLDACRFRTVEATMRDEGAPQLGEAAPHHFPDLHPSLSGGQLPAGLAGDHTGLTTQTSAQVDEHRQSGHFTPPGSGARNSPASPPRPRSDPDDTG